MLQFDIREIIGLTFAVTLVNSIAAAIPFYKNKSLPLKESCLIGFPAAVSVIFGHALGAKISSETLTLIIISALFFAGIKLFRDNAKHKVVGIAKKNSQPLLLACFGVLIGLIMGIMGGGGGLFISIVLIIILHFPVKEALAISIVVMGLAGISGTWINYASGNIYLPFLLIMMIPSTLCAYSCGVVANKIDASLITQILGIYLLIISSVLIIKQLLVF